MSDTRPSATPDTASECVTCHGAGYLRHDVGIDHADFGKIEPCACKIAERTQRRAALLHQHSGLARFVHKTFAGLNPHREGLYPAYQRCVEYAQAPANWLILRGTYGCGKTHLAAAIAQAVLERDQSVVFATTPDMLDCFRSATFNPDHALSYDEYQELLRTVDLLVLDDLGAENQTAYGEEKIFQILNHRLNHNKPTVITTNLENNALYPRIASRFRDITTCEELLITATDFRPLSFQERLQ